MNFSRWLSSSLIQASCALGVSLMILSRGTWLLSAPPPPAPAVAAPEAKKDPPIEAPAKKEVPKSASEKAQELGIGKREYKALKRERQRQDMLKRIAQRGVDGTSSRRPPVPDVPPSPPRPAELTEDFDAKVNWEAGGAARDAFVSTPASYGYSSANHFASAGCAPGEIGGTVSDNSLSWFADNVADDSASLDRGIL